MRSEQSNVREAYSRPYVMVAAVKVSRPLLSGSVLPNGSEDVGFEDWEPGAGGSEGIGIEIWQ